MFNKQTAGAEVAMIRVVFYRQTQSDYSRSKFQSCVRTYEIFLALEYRFLIDDKVVNAVLLYDKTLPGVKFFMSNSRALTAKNFKT